MYFHGNGSSKRAAWLQEFEQRVIEVLPSAAGHIDWDTAVHLYNSGHSTDDAARRYISIPR